MSRARPNDVPPPCSFSSTGKAQIGLSCRLGLGFGNRRSDALRLRRGGANSPGSGGTGGAGATSAHFHAPLDRYGVSYSYRVAGTPNGDAIPRARCCPPFAYPDTPTDAHTHDDEHADAYAGSHAHRSTRRSWRSTDLAFDDLRDRQCEL